MDLSKSYVKDHFGVWESVLGFDLTPMVGLAAQRALDGPVITKACLSGSTAFALGSSPPAAAPSGVAAEYLAAPRRLSTAGGFHLRRWWRRSFSRRRAPSLRLTAAT